MVKTVTMSMSAILSVLALVTVYAVYLALSDVSRLVSPQGCRMSWMSPSYLLQSEFNTSWTPLANRYTLWLYREVGWEPSQPVGVPALFIHGSAGSSHQVRSIASSAARQYFSSPFVISSEFNGRGIRPVDFYAVDFNEDFSAFHGPTLDSQIAYTAAAIRYILSRYPPNTQIIVIGHSMGGIVGTALLPSPDISALITMSTPHMLPPVRFDSRIEEIYARNSRILREDETPILSLCGGATDTLVLSESCVIPDSDQPPGGLYRRTVFTSALQGTWTGVGHLEMVWCHQVRWRVARAALELGGAVSARDTVATQRGRVLDRWLGDGVPVLDEENVELRHGTYEILPQGMHLVLKNPHGKRTYLLPLVPADGEGPRTFVLYVSRGAISGIAPHHAPDLQVSIQLCVPSSARTDGAELSVPTMCTPLQPNVLKLLPSPLPGRPFPVPNEGSDESEGVVLFEGEISSDVQGWIGVSINAGEQEGGGWVVSGFDRRKLVERDAVSLSDLILGTVHIPLTTAGGEGGLRTHVHISRLPLNALLVYKLVPDFTDSSSCADAIFPPLLMHVSQPSEVHYYPLRHDNPVWLHSHSTAPYVPSLEFNPEHHGLNLTIYSYDYDCADPVGLTLTLDWWGTLGRLGTRYPTTLLSFCVGIVSVALFQAWQHSAAQPQSVSESLETLVRRVMPQLMGVAALIALLPLSHKWYLGLSGELGLLASLLAVFLVGLASGLVCLSWWVLRLLIWPLRFVAMRVVPSRRPEDSGLRRSTVPSMVLMLLFIFLFVPWQVAFLGCWVIQLLNCAVHPQDERPWNRTPTTIDTPIEAIPLRPQREDGGSREPTEDGIAETLSTVNISRGAIPGGGKPTPPYALIYQNAHILLFLTWLLPFTAPVLVVWVRTLLTAGYTTPFNGDHNVFKVLPILWLVDYLGRGHVLDTRNWRGISPRWGFLVVGLVSFVVGGRWVYLVYDVANVQIAFLLFWDVVVASSGRLT
ncbi:PGAP1-like protein-domain-containing protein [Pisolithus orientalis]|uniref:PGAP1-like protein-domain-containing protein n=1 Tax=Pisolithus orientalis TaxID=936130 RepID=UPI002225B1BE|nr:PGAP1-like protein-domain-containing protein [Pisolithus orientalis]KAI6034884.1 PGAP1-like protein-domain-containing protein [Pisolithus orientalis]